MKALLAVLGTSFAVNLCQIILQVACHEKDGDASHCFKRDFSKFPLSLPAIRTHRAGKICRHEDQGLKMSIDNKQLKIFAKSMNPTILSKSIVSSFAAGQGVLDISFLMGFTHLNSVQGWQRGRKPDEGSLPYPNRRFP